MKWWWATTAYALNQRYGWIVKDSAPLRTSIRTCSVRTVMIGAPFTTAYRCLRTIRSSLTTLGRIHTRWNLRVRRSIVLKIEIWILFLVIEWKRIMLSLHELSPYVKTRKIYSLAHLIIKCVKLVRNMDHFDFTV